MTNPPRLWRTLLLWLLATWAAGLLYWGLTYLLNWAASNMLGEFKQDLPNWDWAAVGLLSTAVNGLILGFAQVLVLRRHLPQLPRRSWVSHTTVGMLLRYLVEFLLAAALLSAFSTFLFTPLLGRGETHTATWSTSLSQIVSGVMFEALVGWTQWLVLRQYVGRAGLWIVAAALSAFFGHSIIQLGLQFQFSITQTFSDPLLSTTFGALSATIGAVITGLTVVYLVRRPLPTVRTQHSSKPIEPTSSYRLTGEPGDVQMSDDDVEAANVLLAPAILTLHSQTGVIPNRPETSKKTFPQYAWPLVTGTTMVLGMLLWIFLFTDYSLSGTAPDILFPPAVFVLGIAAFMWAGYARTRATKVLGKLSTLPAIVGGSLYLVAVGLAFMPPLTLSAMFHTDAIASETRLQEVVSPDGLRVATVYWQGGGYAGSFNKPLLVKVRYSLIPFVERDVFSTAVHLDISEGKEYVSWSDNDTLLIRETGDVITVGTIKADVPLVFRVATSQFQTWERVGRQRHATQAMEATTQVATAQVQRVPLYPGHRTHDQVKFQKEDDTQFRSYNLDDVSANQVADWYKQALSQAPWLLVRSDRYKGDDLGSPYTRDCIQARHIEGEENDDQIYYVEIMGSGSEQGSVHVNIGTPHPITDACKRYTNRP